MSLVPSLLNAILRLDGEALVMHVGEKPYVVAPTGQVELASRALTFDAVSGMVAQLLPSELQHALDEFGAVQYEFPSMPEFAGERFTVVAARGGDDIWVEVRRRRQTDDDTIPEDVWDAPAEPVAVASTPAAIPPAPPVVPSQPIVAPQEYAQQTLPQPEPVRAPEAAAPVAVVSPAEPAAEIEEEVEIDLAAADAEEANAAMSEVDRLVASVMATPPSMPRDEPAYVEEPHPIAAQWASAEPPIESPVEPPVEPAAPEGAAPADREPAAAASVEGVIDPAAHEERAAHAPVVRPVEEPEDAPTPLSVITGYVRPAAASSGVVLPMTRSVKGEAPPPIAVSPTSGLDRLLRTAAARGASTLYLTSEARPSMRVDGEIQPLAGEAPLTAGDVESLLIDLMPERNREELRSGIGTEWICDVAEVGRVRCMTFRDHRGAGGIFRMMPVHAISADQLGLSREIQALAAEPEGLVLVAGPRSSGKSTLVAAFVDLINRTRRDHVITIESEIKVVHEQRSSLVSQREVRGSTEQMLGVVRSAMRENPDVLVIEELRSADIVSVALDAAGSGHLVIAALPAHTATAAVDRIIDLYPPEQRRHVQLSLAEDLRGIVSQVLLRKPSGGRVAAREILLNTPAVASVIAEGKTSQLPLAIEGGRKYGMVPLNDALAGFVQSGAVDAREAYRRAADRAGFLALLKRQGIDTSVIERLA